MAHKQSTGQAYSKDQRYIYTCYTDGTVSRQEVRGGYIGNEEPVDRRVTWNDRDFWAFVPVQAALDAQEG